MIRTLLERKQHGRRYRVLHASSVSDLTAPIEGVDQQHPFVSLFVAPSWETEKQNWVEATKNLLEQGLCYCCTWADGSAEGLHDLVDDITVDLKMYENDPECVVMTTWHDDEDLPQAAWFFVHCAFPSGTSETLCHDWIAIAVGDSNLAIDTMKAVKAQLD